MQNPVARVYAQALFELAQEKNELDAVAAEMDTFMQSYDSLLDVRRVLQSPKMRTADYGELLEKMVGGKPSRLFANFVGLLRAKRRFVEMPGIHEAFRELRDEKAGRVRCRVTVVGESDPEMLALVKDFIMKRAKNDDRHLHLEVKSDPAILGGAVIRVGDKVLDASLRTQLRRLAQTFRETAENPPQ